MEIRNKILVQTFSLIMKYGIKSVSMDDISRGIGISKKTIYQHFENKKALILSVVDNHITTDEQEMGKIIAASENAIEEMISIAKHALNFLKGMSPSMMFDTQKYYPQVWQRVEKQHFTFIRDSVQHNIERGQNEGLYCTDLNAEIMSKLYIRQILALADDDIFPQAQFDRSDLYKNMVTYHIRGLMTTKGRAIAKNLELE